MIGNLASFFRSRHRVNGSIHCKIIFESGEVGGGMEHSEEARDIPFSVVIPIYKVEDCLERCVDSVLGQSFEDFEVILVDDGSPDGCPALCDRYGERDSRVRVLHKENGGLVSARNAGIKAARGRYVCYVDGDDWVSDRLLETMYRALGEQGEPDMVVYRAVYQYDVGQEDIPCHVESGLYDKARLEREIYPAMMYDAGLPFFTGKVFPAAWNKIYRRELLLEHYCRDERIGLAEDNAFVFECLYFADSVYFCEDRLYYYNRCNEGSMISCYNEKYLEKSQLVCQYLRERLGGRQPYLDRQIQVFQAAWLMMAAFHEVRFGPSGRIARGRIREKIGKSHMIGECSFAFLPLVPKIYLLLLKMHCYSLVWLVSRLRIK